MKTLFLILILLIPSISIAEPLIGCDNGDVVRELRWLQIAIIESQRPTYHAPPEQPKPLPPQPNKELTLEQMKIKLYLYGGCK
jgi:hypothetical protein